MDQGIAGVIAGVAGLVGAGIGGLATAYGARIGAQKSMEAVQVQVQRQSTAEHKHWVREQRRQVYTQVADAYADCAKAATRCFERMNERNAIPSDLMESLDSAVDGLTIMRGHIQLWGPPNLEGAVFLLTSEVAALQEEIQRWPAIYTTWDDSAMAEHSDRCNEQASRAIEATNSFLGAARRTLAEAQ
ncbi:hypothetical protein [Streptomyces coelicoflavus]|uniref:Uncharacterized protein n=1 Tax=Streptomyces coelicoflavus TaxID=285562 RepID=A0A6N9UM97_9ACTN|nr:hypothetical protein [Streptomyces coelicoflavus]NEB16192.1 hypothetical protein [Streptomyces coelicoflavus]